MLAETLHAERQQWQRQRELMEAQTTATILQLRAEASEARMAVFGTMLPPDLAEQVAGAARQLIVNERAPSSRVLRIERDKDGALVPIYDELEPEPEPVVQP